MPHVSEYYTELCCAVINKQYVPIELNSYTKFNGEVNSIKTRWLSFNMHSLLEELSRN